MNNDNNNTTPLEKRAITFNDVSNVPIYLPDNIAMIYYSS